MLLPMAPVMAGSVLVVGLFLNYVRDQCDMHMLHVNTLLFFFRVLLGH